MDPGLFETAFFCILLAFLRRRLIIDSLYFNAHRGSYQGETCHHITSKNDWNSVLKIHSFTAHLKHFLQALQVHSTHLCSNAAKLKLSWSIQQYKSDLPLRRMPLYVWRGFGRRRRRKKRRIRKQRSTLTLLLRTGTGFGFCGLNPFLRFCNRQTAVKIYPHLLQAAVTPFFLSLPSDPLPLCWGATTKTTQYLWAKKEEGRKKKEGRKERQRETRRTKNTSRKGLQPLILKCKQFTKRRLHWKSDFRLEVAWGQLGKWEFSTLPRAS